MKNVISNTFTITAQKPTVSVDHIDNFYIVEATGTQPAVDDSRWQFVEAGDPTPKTTPAAPYLWHKTITWLTDGTHLDPVVEFAGSMGQNGIDYDLVPSHSAIIKDENDNRTPANVTCALVKRNADGTADTQSTVPTGYSIKVTKDTTTSTYTLGSNVSTAGVSVIVFSLWYGAVEIERHTISVVAEGGQGVDGRGIQSQDYRFKATSSNSQPATPATAAQWNEWKALNAAGYSESVPYLWRCCRTVYVDGHGNTETEYIVDGPTVWGKNGNDSIVLDIDNEMDSIPADSTGKTLAAVVLTTNYRLYKGSTNITAQGTAPTVANIKIAGVTPVLTTNSEYVEVKWTIPAGTTLGAEKYIASIPVSYGGNTYRKDFTANVVKSGQPGVSPSIYQLLLSCTEVSFARNSSNVLTPSSVNVRCGYTKTTGATIEKHVGDKLADLQSIDSKYNILYRPIQANGTAGSWAWMKDLSSANFYLNIPSSTTHVAYEFVLTTAASASAVADSNIVDRETLPINKDGLNGAPGESAFVIDLDNDTDAFGTDSDGKISTAINRETKATMYYGVSPLTLTGLSATKTYEDGTACGSEVAVTTDTETGKVTVTMGSTSFAYKKTIFIDITGVCSRGSKTIRFTIQPQASGEPGVSPIIYQLMPTPSTLSFARNSSGSLIIENNVITCLVKRTEENDSTILSSLSGYNVFYGYGNVTTPSNKINVGGTITVNASNAANYTQLVIELWKMNGNTKVTRLDRETIPITKEGQKGQKGDDGETPFVVDIDNEMTSIPISQEGKVVNQIQLSFNIGAFYGQTNVIDDCTVALSGTAPSGFTVDTTTQKSNPRITIAANTQPAEITELRFKVKHSTYGEREAVFSIASVKSGGKGEDAVLYELLPSESQISVGRTDAGGYNPSTASLKCGYIKKAGTAAPTTVDDATGAVDGYSIYFRRYNRSSGWGYIYNYVSYKSSYLTGFSVATYSKVQFFLCKNTQSYLTSESGLTGLIDKETVPVVADGQKGSNGTSAFILDIDNEMAAIPVNTEGKVESQIQITFGLEAYYGTGSVTSDCSISVGSLPSGFHVNTDNKSAPIVTIDQNTKPAEITEITFTAVHATYGTREAVFTVCAVKSGGKGADAELYQLLPNYTSFQFQRDSNGNLTGSFQLTCQIQKIVGSTITNHNSLSGYNIYYGWDSIASPTTNWAGFLNITTSHASTYKNIVLELWRGNRTSGTRLDRETIPLLRDGSKGAGGDEGNGIDTVTIARMFTTNFVQPSNTDSGWINEGYSNYPTEAGLSDVNHYLWQRKKTTYTKSSNVTYEVVLFAQFIDGVHENLLDDTAFLSEGEMEAWDHKNGAIGQKTIGNHNSFGGTPVWEDQYTELLQQKVYKYGTVQKLKPNTWYTLSFYGAMVSYQDLLTSSVYNGSDGSSYWQIGASRRSFWLEAGQSALITVTGRCYSTSVFLRVFGFRDDWGGGMTKGIDFTSTSSETKSFKLTNTGTSAALFHVEGYVYLTDGSETQNSYSDINHRAYITLIRLDRGCKLNTYLYRSDNGQAVQHSTSAPWYVDGKKFTSRGSLQDSNTGHVVTVNGVQENVHDGTVVNFTDDGSVLWQMSAGTLRHSVTFKTPSSLSYSAEYRVLFRLAQYSHYCWISMPKLEEGTAATDWIESSNDRKAEDIQHVFVGNWVASTQGDKSTYYFFGGGTGVRHVVRARKSASGAYTYWRMKQRTTSEGYYSTAQPYNDTAHWEQADYLKFIAAEFALIDEAIIKFTQTNRILVYNSAGTVAAGMGGAPGGSNDFPLWVGASYENRANASFRVSLTGILYATGAHINGSIDATNITASSGKIAGFTLSGNGLTNIVSQSDMSQSSNMGYIICRNDYYGRFAGIGANVLPATSGLVSAVARFENTDSHSWYSTNIALLLRAENGQNNNFAFTGTGNGVLNGWVGGYKYSRFILTSTNTIYDGYVTLKENNVWFIKANVSNSGIALPKLSKVRDALGIGSSTNFCVRLLICADINANQVFDIYGRNQKQSSSGTKTWNTDELPLMTHWDNSNWDTCPMGQGDSLELLLVYDSSRTETINGYSTKYTARIINRQD